MSLGYHRGTNLQSTRSRQPPIQNTAVTKEISPALVVIPQRPDSRVFKQLAPKIKGFHVLAMLEFASMALWIGLTVWVETRASSSAWIVHDQRVDTRALGCVYKNLTCGSTDAACAPYVASYDASGVSDYISTHASTNVMLDADRASRVDLKLALLVTTIVAAGLSFLQLCFFTAMSYTSASTTTRTYATYALVPTRFFDTAIVSVLMSFLINHVLMVFTFDALVGIAAAQGAMAFVWMGVEALAGFGAVHLAHTLLWLAGVLLFATQAVPAIYRFVQLLPLLFESCATGECRTCFGTNNPIDIFIIVVLTLQALRPLITVLKLYLLDTRVKAWLREPCLRFEAQNAALGACLAPLRLVGYLSYILYSAAIGLVVGPVEVFLPFLPCVDTTPVSAPSQYARTFALVWCEALHIVTNVLFRGFVVVYVTLVYTQI